MKLLNQLSIILLGILAFATFATPMDCAAAENTNSTYVRVLFLEVPTGTMAEFSNTLNSINSTDDTFIGILTATNAKIILHSLESRQNVKMLAEPEAIATSGRQIQMRVSFDFKDRRVNRDTSFTSGTNQIEIYPILEVIPVVLSDGFTINLTLNPSLTEFDGYGPPPIIPEVAVANVVSVPMVPPKFSVRHVRATVNVWDGQTVILGGSKKPFTVNKFATAEDPRSANKEILFFITANIIDTAGNRVHSEENANELPFAQTGIPPQPK